MSALKRILALAWLLSLVACGVTPTPTAGPPTATAAPGTASPAPVTPGPTLTPPPTVDENTPSSLRVWVPPEFAPDISTPSGRVLADQISAFEEAHPGTAVEIRVKAASGPGGLLNALVNAANVAPAVLPNVIALKRDDLAAAAAGGLVVPLDNLVPADTLSDFYPFAQAMGRASGAWVGLPFAADARVLTYLTSAYASPPLMWADVVTGSLVLPGSESSGLTLLNLYLALGGTLADPDGNLALDAERLAQVLTHLQALQAAGSLPLSTLDYGDTAATWEVFRERRATLAVTSAQWYLAEYFRVEGAAATLLPTRGEPALALADGWSWAVVNARPEQLALCAELLNHLIAPEQHGVWSEAAQVLPTRAATLDGWQSARLVPFVSQVVTHAQVQPPPAVLGVVGPALRQALADVLNGRATPFAAATLAAEMVSQP